MNKEQLRQKLADIEHQRWSDWQAYCHEVLRQHVPISDELEQVLSRWDKQIATPYSQLSEKERDSDMEQVDRYWHLIEQYSGMDGEKWLKRFVQELTNLNGGSGYDLLLLTQVVIPAAKRAANIHD